LLYVFHIWKEINLYNIGILHKFCNSAVFFDNFAEGSSAIY